MGDFDWFQNVDLRKALELRRDGNYKEALKFLRLSADNGCGQAYYFLAEAYLNGGWGLRVDQVVAFRGYMKAKEHDCTWGLKKIANAATTRDIAMSDPDPITRIQFDYNDQKTIKELEVLWKAGNFVALKFLTEVDTSQSYRNIRIYTKLAQLGDGQSQVKCAEALQASNLLDQGFKYTLQAAKQRVKNQMIKLSDCYKHGLGCRVDPVKATKWNAKSRGVISYEIQQFVNGCAEHLSYGLHSNRFQQLWYIGYYTNPDACLQYDHLKLPGRIYNETSEKVRKAIYCWLIIGRKVGLCRDLTRTIALLVRKERKNPHLWGIKN